MLGYYEDAVKAAQVMGKRCFREWSIRQEAERNPDIPLNAAGKGLTVSGNSDCPLFTLVSTFLNGEKESESNIHVSLCPKAANKMEPVLS